MKVSVIIPTLNEAGNIGAVISDFNPNIVDECIVIDGGSTDETVSIAQSLGARVVIEVERGYGRACAAGVRAASGEILVFMDGDGANVADDIQHLLKPILKGRADLVLGSRMRGRMQASAMPSHQYFGNWLAGVLVRRLYGVRVTDLAPFRAIRADKLDTLNMLDMTYGWPTEMLVKAIRLGLRIEEISVASRMRRSGRSKISGTLKGTLQAAYHILSTTFKFARQSQLVRSAQRKTRV